MIPLRLRAAAELERRRRLRQARDEKPPTPEWGRAHPVEWIEKVLGLSLTQYQREIVESTARNRRTAVATCHSVGKDFIAAAIVIWFVQCHEPCKVITTAPTDRQVRQVLWAYIREMWSNARYPLRGRITTQQIEVGPNHYALGFTSSDYNPSAGQGYHADDILIVFDESTGISPGARAGLESALASGSNAHALDIGNPTDPVCDFADMFDEDRRDVNPIQISAFDTPNFTAFGITEQDYIDDTWEEKITGPLPAPYLTTPAYVFDVWNKSRRNPRDPEWMSRVLGQFPDSAENAVFPMSWLREAVQRGKQRPPLDYRVHGKRTRGVDVARLGQDETWAADYVPGWGVAPLVRIPRGDLIETAKWIDARMAHTQRVRIDADGVGAGVYDWLHHAALKKAGLTSRADALIVEIRSGRKAIDAERYTNRRAEMAFAMADMLDPDGDVKLALPDDRELIRDLAAFRWGSKPDGRRFVHSKEDMKEWLKRSPDRADAVIYAVAGHGSDPIDKTEKRRQMLKGQHSKGRAAAKRARMIGR